MKSIDETLINNWFTASTIQPDNQLNGVIKDNPQWNNRRTPSQTELHQTLFGCDSVYNNYRGLKPGNDVPTIPHISHASLNAISKIINKPPRFIVEVGSFIGASARVLAEYVKDSDGQVLCVDTWCGDINMWLMRVFDKYMLKQDGDPKLYDRFMHNMIDWGITNYVTPLRVSSVVGARMLKVLNFDIDVIYLDSAHEAGETFLELSLYYDVLNNNGVIFGDDFDNFPAVCNDVKEFCRVNGLEYFMLPDPQTWAIYKS
jgi:predicted O-methyltransferase YrrM